MSLPAAPAETVLHDRGYTRFSGARDHSTRLPVIALHTFGRGLSQVWVKLSLILASFPPVVAGVMFYIQHALIRQVSAATPLEEGGRMAGALFVLHLLVSWYGALFAAFTIALATGSPAIADDLRSGALPFYLTRPLSRFEYLGGKWLGALGTTLLCTLGAALFSIFHFSLALPEERFTALLLIGRTAGFCLLQAATLATVAVAISAVSTRRSFAQAGFAALFFLPWLCGAVVAHFSQSFWPSLLSLPALLESVGRPLLGLAVDDSPTAVPPLIAAPALAGLIAASVGLAILRIGKVARS